MVVQTPPMTVETFWTAYAGKPFELVHGKVVEVSPSGHRASELAVIIAAEIRLYLKTNPQGRITGADGGYLLDGYNLRAPDVGYIGPEKADRLTEPEKYAPFAPDLAVEVVSPNDGALDLQEKVELYLRSGVSLVWVVFPELSQVVVYRPDRTVSAHTVSDTLDGEEVLPGFRMPLADIFQTP